ncbi:carboxypeptidase-like regulatory domain-containing protein [Massilia sp. P8910]|uniref:carboxypeptidase-like regulatory domain-containing protein n=1 Tax=Massilia antarctica TaxID=2765360 RepID=UPI0006BB73B5|nr:MULTISPECIES: carboxypeptidase-like regulatory domain-containing protein [Massilia]MCE3603676.1 carboxypeptidase-like regulatory domain-containing protein [Massilia antarctica]MCY0916470.1 carboxypeptidase-like regulatory domain-containing protein [Massilia sp. H27-R4]CUI07401.1 hypothetical protein BN2497_9579 [Janthinobacterium sp. CG23_2]CUU31187.1 hypothetical protein BN3177_9579 [Janthinobacterium sp. CG23_2]
MSYLPRIEHVTHTPHMALSLVDRLAQALHMAGAFPPILGEITCEVVAATAPAPRMIDPPRLLSVFRNRSGYLILDGSYADPADRTRYWPLGAGTYRVRVRGELYQDAEFLLAWPPAPGQRRIPIPQPGNADSVELLPSAAYPLPDVTLGRLQLGVTILRGSAFAADGTPLAGVVAEVINLAFPPPPSDLPPLGDWPFLRTVSGANGDWALLLPGRRYIDSTVEIPPAPTLPLTKPIAVRVAYPDGPVSTIQTVLLGSEHAVRNTALRGQVLGPGGRPLAGAHIATSASARTSITRADGLWTLYFDLNQGGVANISVSATAPGQAPQTDATATLRPGSTVFVPTFHFP